MAVNDLWVDAVSVPRAADVTDLDVTWQCLRYVSCELVLLTIKAFQDVQRRVTCAMPGEPQLTKTMVWKGSAREQNTSSIVQLDRECSEDFS